MVNVHKYQVVAIGDTVNEWEERYQELLLKEGIQVEEDVYKRQEYVRKESPYYNEAKWVQYLERAKEQGNDRAKYFVGNIYLDKISSEYSPELGLQYMTCLLYTSSPR